MVGVQSDEPGAGIVFVDSDATLDRAFAGVKAGQALRLLVCDGELPPPTVVTAAAAAGETKRMAPAGSPPLPPSGDRPPLGFPTTVAIGVTPPHVVDVPPSSIVPANVFGPPALPKRPSVVPAAAVLSPPVVALPPAPTSPPVGPMRPRSPPAAIPALPPSALLPARPASPRADGTSPALPAGTASAAVSTLVSAAPTAAARVAQSPTSAAADAAVAPATSSSSSAIASSPVTAGPSSASAVPSSSVGPSQSASAPSSSSPATSTTPTPSSPTDGAGPAPVPPSKKPAAAVAAVPARLLRDPAAASVLMPGSTILGRALSDPSPRLAGSLSSSGVVIPLMTATGNVGGPTAVATDPRPEYKAVAAKVVGVDASDTKRTSLPPAMGPDAAPAPAVLDPSPEGVAHAHPPAGHANPAAHTQVSRQPSYHDPQDTNGELPDEGEQVWDDRGGVPAPAGSGSGSGSSIFLPSNGTGNVGEKPCPNCHCTGNTVPADVHTLLPPLRDRSVGSVYGRCCSGWFEGV